MEPTITIITPTHNIIETSDAFNLLVSLLDLQTYPNIEHLVVDNASDDGTIELLKDYKNKGYITFYSERDTGKYSAINKAVMRAKGKYIAILSYDDFIHDITAIADIVQLMEDNEADFLFSPAYCRHPQGFTFLFPPAIYNVFQAMPCGRQAMFFKKSFIEKIGYFDEKFKIMSDFDFIIRAVMKRGKAVYFDRNYVTYKLSQKSIDFVDKALEESRAIFFKNYKGLYPLNEDVLERMVQISQFPPALLEKLAEFFPPEDKEIFLDRCEAMHQLRKEVRS